MAVGIPPRTTRVPPVYGIAVAPWFFWPAPSSLQLVLPCESSKAANMPQFIRLPGLANRGRRRYSPPSAPPPPVIAPGFLWPWPAGHPLVSPCECNKVANSLQFIRLNFKKMCARYNAAARHHGASWYVHGLCHRGRRGGSGLVVQTYTTIATICNARPATCTTVGTNSNAGSATSSARAAAGTAARLVQINTSGGGGMGK